MLDFTHAKYPPFKHQIEDTAAVVSHPFYFITSEMRTGKTKIVIDAAQFLFHRNLIDRVIVVCPEPVRSVWVGATADALGGELREHLWDITPTLVTEFHSDVNQWRVGPEPALPLKIIVTNYDFIRPYRREGVTKKIDASLRALLKYCGPKTLLVLDECAAITNHKSSQFAACYKMRMKCGRVVLMDGAPMDNPGHLFAPGMMLHDSVLECRYITHYRNRYAVMGGYRVGAVRKKDANGKVTWVGGRPTQVIGWTNLDDIQRRFKPYTVRRLQADCLDLPPKLKAVTLRATLGAQSWSVYKEMRDEMVVLLEDGNASVSQQAIVKFMRLAQITGGFLGGIEDAGLDPPCVHCDGIGCDECEGSGIGPVLAVPSVRELGREKLDVLLWLVENKLEKDPTIKIVVWARFIPETMRILSEARTKFPQMIVAGMHGGQTKTERTYAKSILDPRTAPAGPVLVVGTLGTGSYGLDFSASHVSVNYSYDHSLRKFLQSGDRVYGPRQTQPVEYFDIVAVGPKGQRTYDAVIVQARRDKQELATWTTDAWVKALREPTQARAAL